MEHKISITEKLEQLISSVPERKIYCSLVSRDKERYRNLPRRQTPDGEYDIIYRILLERNAQDVKSVLITNDLADKMSMDEDRLHELAMKNTPELFPPRMERMEELFAEIEEVYVGKKEFAGIMDILPDEIAEINMIRKTPRLQNAFVLSNEEGINGAGAMYYEDKKILRELSENLQKDLYILPSSIHEVIVLPDEEEIHASELAEIVKQVNSTAVAPKEILGWQPLHYDKNTNTLAVARDRDNSRKEQNRQNNKEMKEHRHIRKGGR